MQPYSAKDSIGTIQDSNKKHPIMMKGPLVLKKRGILGTQRRYGLLCMPRNVEDMQLISETLFPEREVLVEYKGKLNDSSKVQHTKKGSHSNPTSNVNSDTEDNVDGTDDSLMNAFKNLSPGRSLSYSATSSASSHPATTLDASMIACYGHLSFAAIQKSPLFILLHQDQSPSTAVYIHFKDVVRFNNEYELGAACYFEIQLFNSEYKFKCSSSVDYQEWITNINIAFTDSFSKQQSKKTAPKVKIAPMTSTQNEPTFQSRSSVFPKNGSYNDLSYVIDKAFSTPEMYQYGPSRTDSQVYSDSVFSFPSQFAVQQAFHQVNERRMTTDEQSMRVDFEDRFKS